MISGVLSATILIVVFFVRVPRPPPPAGEESIATIAASDRALRAGDPDRLEFAPLAVGIARFLANEKTEPPLTLAITGK